MAVRVLLVHDERGLLQDWGAALVGAGYDVTAFDQPMAALKAIDAGQALDVLVTRLNFGEGQPNGISLATMIKRKRPAIKVVFIGAAGLEIPTDDLGMFLRLPVEPPELVFAVQRMLVGESVSP